MQFPEDFLDRSGIVQAINSRQPHVQDGLLGATPDMGSNEKIGEAQEFPVCWRFLGEDVKCRASQTVMLEHFFEFALIDEITAGHVYEMGFGVH